MVKYPDEYAHDSLDAMTAVLESGPRRVLGPLARTIPSLPAP